METRSMMVELGARDDEKEDQAGFSMEISKFSAKVVLYRVKHPETKVFDMLLLLEIQLTELSKASLHEHTD